MKKSGGSEYQYSNVEGIVPPHINLMLNNFNIIKNKFNIHWQHQYFDQPSAQPLRKFVNDINCVVFVSHHQKHLFDRFFGLPYEKSTVIQNGFDPFPRVQKSNNKINLIYASTPFRGLDILLTAYTMMLARNKELRGIVNLDVFSSMEIYGGQYMELESKYTHLYEHAKKHPDITYHGAVDRDVLRVAMLKANLLAYPCTFEETSCCTAIEAMGAGVIPVVSNIGALPEICSVYGKYYSPLSTDLYNCDNKEKHALQYSYILEKEIYEYLDNVPYEHIDKMIDFIEFGHSWKKVLPQWKELFAVFN